MVEANTYPGPINNDGKQRKGQPQRKIDKGRQRDELSSQEGVIRGEPVVSSVRNEWLEVPDRKRARIIVEKATDQSKDVAEDQEYSGRNSPPKRQESWPTIEQASNHYRCRENVDEDEVVGQEDGERGWHHVAVIF